MADVKKGGPSGGNTPKPKTGASGKSAKDQSRQQSRSVPTRGSGKGGNTPRPGRAAPAAAGPRKLSGALMAWMAVGLVIIVIVVLVVVKVTGGSNSANASYTPVTPAPASVVHDVTHIPLSVYNKVGVTSQVQVIPPIVLTGQPPLKLGGTSPAMFYLGAEYCPYSAAERWAMTAALSRFGIWTDLKITASSHTDVDAMTHTFSYYGANFTSPYLSFFHVEQESNVPTANGYYQSLQNPTKAEAKVIAKYNDPKYITGATVGQVSYPFVNIGNKVLISGASYDPGILSGQSWSQIASGLSDASNPATQAIVVTANYITAAICASTKGAPSSVCTSSGVEAAAKALKLS